MISDPYERKARIYPALLVAFPVSLLGVILGVTESSWWPAVSGVAIGSGFYVVAAQLGRHRGKAMEPELFSSWGGIPTTDRLRHRGPTNQVRLARLHSQLEVITGLVLPTEHDEESNPKAADDVYETAVHVLRGRTRNRQRFPLVFKELCNYGFRRNSLGLRSWGIAVALAAAAGAASCLLLDSRLDSVDFSGVGLWLVLGASLLIACVWVFFVSANWVRQTAEAYADRLIDAIEDLYDGAARVSGN